MNDADGADPAPFVGLKRGLDGGRVGAASPVGLQKDRLQSKPLRHFAPERCEPACARHHDRVAWRERIDERGFPRAGAGSGKDEHRVVRLEDALEAGQDRTSERGEVGAAMVDRGFRDRAQDAARHVRRAWDLQEVAAWGAGVHSAASNCGNGRGGIAPETSRAKARS